MRAIALCLSFLLCGWAHIRAGDDPDDPPLHWTRDYQIPIHVHSDGYEDLAFNEVRGALEAALDTWDDTGITVSFVRDRDGQDGDTPAMDGVNVVRFEHDRLPREVDPDRVLAFASPVAVTCSGMVAEVDITFNAVTVDWSVGDGGRRADIETVMLHESGHLLGLDHTDNRNAVMFPSIQERSRRALHNDDLAGIRALYAADLGLPCDRDADCEATEACIFQVQSTGDFETRCAPKLGNRRVGQACNSNRGFCSTGCAAGFCLGDDICSGVCRDDRDCPGDLTCLPQDTGGGQIVKFCLNLRLCEDRVSECDDDQACVVTRHPEEARALRICIDRGDGATGTPCRSFDDCQGGFCQGGLCTELCDGAADCDAPFACQPTQLNLGAGVVANIGLCEASQDPCARQRDCADGLSCAYIEFEGEVRSLCVPGEGGAAEAACEDGGDCRSAVCLDGQCSDVCRNDGDCPRSMECQRIRFLGESVNACVPIEIEPPGPDMGGPPPPDPDAGGPPPPDPDGGRVPPPDPDAGGGIVRSDGGGGRADGAVVIIAPVDGNGSGGAPGCGCAQPGGSAGPTWWLLLLFGVPVLRTRRRRR